MSGELTLDAIAMVVGAAISLAASYLPGFRAKWAALDDDRKRSAMAVATIATGVVLYVLACVPALAFPFMACPAGGVWSLIGTIIAALVANQATDRVSPDTADVKIIKAAQKAEVARLANQAHRVSK